MSHRASGIAVAGFLFVAAPASAAAEQGAPHVDAVRALVEAVAAGDRAAFEAAFAEEVLGMQPAALWEGANNLVGQWGSIEEVSLAKLDDGGAYVTLRLVYATREVFVQLDEEEKRIRQLVYEP